MNPLLITGVASIASNLIDKWANASQQKAAVAQAKFEGAMDKALAARGIGGTAGSPLPGAHRAALQAEILSAPEVRSVLDAQDPARASSLQITEDGRLLLHRANGTLSTELQLAPATQALARQWAALDAPRTAVGRPV